MKPVSFRHRFLMWAADQSPGLPEIFQTAWNVPLATSSDCNFTKLIKYELSRSDQQ